MKTFIIVISVLAVGFAVAAGYGFGLKSTPKVAEFHDMFIVSLVCSNLNGTCTEMHHKRPANENMSFCQMLAGHISAKEGPDDPERALKRYCQYEEPGLSYMIIKRPNGDSRTVIIEDK
jgi:hypothetical protein